MRSRRGGMTVVETLVSASVGLFVLVAIANLLVRGLDMWTVGHERSSAQQGALLATHRMLWELQTSDVKSVTIHAASAAPHRSAISFLSAMKEGRVVHDDLGELLWQKFVVFYHDPETSTIRRHEEPIDPATVTPELPFGQPSRDPDPVTITTFTPQASDPIVASGILSMSAALTRNENPVTITVRSGNDRHASSLTASAILENGFLKQNPVGLIRFAQAYRLSLPRYESAVQSYCVRFNLSTLSLRAISVPITTRQLQIEAPGL